MAKVTVVTCDNCYARVEGKAFRMEAISQDWCSDCKEGKTFDLVGVSFRLWPKRVTKESILPVLEEHDQALAEARGEIRDERRANAELARELGRLRRKAADGYASEHRPQDTLKDIASGANREGDHEVSTDSSI